MNINLKNIRREPSRRFGNKQKEYPKAKIEKFETNNKLKRIGTCIGASMTLGKVTSLELM